MAVATLSPTRALRRPRRADPRAIVGVFLTLAALAGSVAFWVSATEARRFQAIPVAFLDSDTILVATSNPANVLGLDDIAMRTGYKVRRAVASRPDRPLFGWAAAYWAGDVASLWAALHAFGGDPGIIAVTLVYATGYLANSVPIPFVATGGMDAATTFALTAVGVPLEFALVAVVAHRVFAFWIPLVPGLVCAAWLRSTGHALARAAGSGEAVTT